MSPHLPTSVYARRFLNARGLVLLLAALVVVALFSPGLSGGFIFDDKANIADNVSLYMMGLDHVSAWRAASSFPYGPGLRLLPMLSFGLDYFRTGSFDPAAYKATNLAIHVITFLVLAGFLRQLLVMAGRNTVQAGWLGVGVALLWAIHPLQVSSVLYVVQRMQTLASLFMLLALWAYLAMRQAQMDGRPWGGAAGWVVFTGVLALACKEDAVLLPVFALLLELTVLRFAAHHYGVERLLRWGYAALVILGVAVFVLWAAPRYGSLETFPGRDFNSFERVLSQARVLVMYLGQILWPVPDSMPFYYDNFPVSRGWLRPPVTLLSWLVLGALMVVAWCQRRHWPLLSLGVLWFFAGHLVTSNVLGLELVFEHRNHFPMIGVILALVLLLHGLSAWAGRRHAWGMGLFALGVIACASATHARSFIWGNDLRLASKSVQLAPHSGRAWVELCRVHFERSANDPASEAYSLAIDACAQGGSKARSMLAQTNLLVLKSVRGDVQASDWQGLYDGLAGRQITPEELRIATILAGNVLNDIPLDPAHVLQAIDLIDSQWQLAAEDYAIVARFILGRSVSPDRALHYLERVAQLAPRDGPLMSSVLAELRAEGRDAWAAHLQAMQAERHE